MKPRIQQWIQRNKLHWGMAIAWRLPRWLVLYAAMRLGAEATTGAYSNQVVPELSFIEALKRWK